MGFLSDIVEGAGDIFSSIKDVAGPVFSAFTDNPIFSAVSNLFSGVTAKDLFSAASAALPFFATTEGQNQVNELSAAEAQRNRDFQSSMFERQFQAQVGMARDQNAVSDLWQQQARLFNQDMAQQNMGFLREMGSTQWQRAVEDMKAAGLSPMLAYAKGPSVGGSTVGGYTSAGQAAGGSVGLPGGSMASFQSGVPAAFNSAYQMGMMMEQLNRTRAETAKIIEDTKTSHAHGNLLDQQNVTEAQNSRRMYEEVKNVIAHTELRGKEKELAAQHITESVRRGNLMEVERQLKELDIPEAFLKARALMRSSDGINFEATPFGSAYPYMRPLGQMISSAASAAASGRYAFGR